MDDAPITDPYTTLGLTTTATAAEIKTAYRQLILKTHVRQPLTSVWAGFDRHLFDRLSPPFPPVTVVRFDGCQRGDLVHLRLHFFLFRQDWISRITEQQTIGPQLQRRISFSTLPL